jgi:DNA-binding NtrC family response regulator
MYKPGISVLIVDDEDGMCKLLKAIVNDMGYTAKSMTSPKKALQLLARENFDIAIIDVKMPEMEGTELLVEALKLNNSMDVIMITAYGSIENAVEAIKMGAFDYISKPFQSDEIKLTLSKIIERKNLIDENLRLKNEINEIIKGGSIIGKSKSMLDIIKFAKKISRSKFTVLITGESGTGKEVIAKFIHNQSSRKSMPFAPVQCSLIPDNLLESELFGYKKGAFTGANTDKPGLLEEANMGTVFLDEIGDIEIDIQGKLLRFLQEHEIRRVGDTKSRILDVRLITATNKNLETMIKDEKFREDLYYRLKVIAIHMPPLRERKDDIPLLVQNFMNEINTDSEQKIEMDRECFSLLLGYDWPGNVRELKNCIESAGTICDNGIIRKEDIANILNYKQTAPEVKYENTTFKESKDKIISNFEKQYIINMLIKHKGNITLSAKESGMDKKNFSDILKKYKISRSDFKQEDW